MCHIRAFLYAKNNDIDNAIPVYRDDEEVERYNIFHASLIVRYSEDGKMYLYDVIDIKKETSNPIEP